MLSCGAWGGALYVGIVSCVGDIVVCNILEVPHEEGVWWSILFGGEGVEEGNQFSVELFSLEPLCRVALWVGVCVETNDRERAFLSGEVGVVNASFKQGGCGDV